MALSVKNPDADRAVRRLAQVLGVSLTEAVRIAAANELKDLEDKKPDHPRESGDPS